MIRHGDYNERLTTGLSRCQEVLIMKYEKAEAEVVQFDEFLEFMMGSLDINNHCNDYKPDSLRHCDDYTVGSYCNGWSSSGATCSSYNGSNCAVYIYKGKTYYNVSWLCQKF